jgi:hypothetical protein
VTEEVAENSCETGSCPIIWNTEEELTAELNTTDQELTKEEIKQVKPAQHTWIKKAAATAGVTTAVVAGLVYYFGNKSDDDDDDGFLSADEGKAEEYVPLSDES